MEIQKNVPLAVLTTFKIGGNARYFVEITKASDLGAALDYAQTRKLPFLVLAGGSNVLIADGGFDGLVIHITFNKVDVYTQDSTITAEAGANLMQLIRKCCEMGLSGMENMYGIPGSVGGAVRGNAGAFGTEVDDVLQSVTALNVATREEKVFTKAECNFAYRQSMFKNSSEWVILSATFQLQRSDPQQSLGKADEILALRNERQIQDIRSAGSFFMNPRVPADIQALFVQEKKELAREGRVPAGWLIDKAGLKGKCTNDQVCTGDRSANYIINRDRATAAEVMTLASEIKTTVGQKFGVELREEVTLVGFSRGGQ